MTLLVAASMFACTLKVPVRQKASGETGVQPPPPPLPGKRQTFLVMGVDERADDSGRSDSMILVSYDPSRDQIAALSLPRDTWVYIPEHGYDKLNHSYAFGGHALALKAVQQFLGIPVDNYVVVNFQGFQKIVDAVGGVEVDVEKDMYYHDPYDGPGGLVIDLKAGRQRLDGLHALHYARFRMDEEGDVGRMRRQQVLMKAMVGEVLKPSNFTSIPALIRSVADAVDTDLSLAEMVKLGVQGRSALKKPLLTGSVQGQEMYMDGVFYLIPDLVTVRTAAFTLLTGEEPNAGFVAQAREAQAKYGAELKKMASAEGLAEPPAQVKSAAPEQSKEPSPKPPSPKEPGSGAKKPPGQTEKGQVRVPVVSLIDASGKSLVSRVASDLKANGFRIARVSRATQVLQRTVILNRSGTPEMVEKVQKLFPGAVISHSPSQSDVMMEIIVGADLP